MGLSECVPAGLSCLFCYCFHVKFAKNRWWRLNIRDSYRWTFAVTQILSDMSKDLKRRLSRIERKLDRIIAITGKQSRPTEDSRIDTLIDRLHRASRRMLDLSRKERENIIGRRPWVSWMRSWNMLPQFIKERFDTTAIRMKPMTLLLKQYANVYAPRMSIRQSITFWHGLTV